MFRDRGREQSLISTSRDPVPCCGLCILSRLETEPGERETGSGLTTGEARGGGALSCPASSDHKPRPRHPAAPRSGGEPVAILHADTGTPFCPSKRAL